MALTWYSTEVQIDNPADRERGMITVSRVTINTANKELHDQLLAAVEAVKNGNPVVTSNDAQGKIMVDWAMKHWFAEYNSYANSDSKKLNIINHWNLEDWEVVMGDARKRGFQPAVWPNEPITSAARFYVWKQLEKLI